MKEKLQPQRKKKPKNKTKENKPQEKFNNITTVSKFYSLTGLNQNATYHLKVQIKFTVVLLVGRPER